MCRFARPATNPHTGTTGYTALPAAAPPPLTPASPVSFQCPASFEVLCTCVARFSSHRDCFLARQRVACLLPFGSLPAACCSASPVLSSAGRLETGPTPSLPPLSQRAPPPACQPLAGQPSAEPILFGSGKNVTVLPRRRRGRTTVLSGAEWMAQPTAGQPLLAPFFPFCISAVKLELPPGPDLFQSVTRPREPTYKTQDPLPLVSQTRSSDRFYASVSHPGWRPCAH